MAKNNKSFEKSIEKSNAIEKDIEINPQNHRVLTGDRPTGSLHIGHLFGSLQNRVKLQRMGVDTFVVIADYQVLTDRDSFENISKHIYELTTDYLACGLDPQQETFIFPHSQVPELNQLIIPFLTLVSNAELNKNPTIKEEIEASNQNTINSGMYVYPVHQAVDILFCKSTIVPVGKDQLPHIELTKTIAKRFNRKFNKQKVFIEPTALLSEAPVILGLDGLQKMSKSRNNSIMIKATEDETANLIKKATTDSIRNITYDPENRPEVSNLLRIASLSSGYTPEQIASEIGDGGSGKLKEYVTDSLNSYLKDIRKKRRHLENNKDYIKKVLEDGTLKARETAVKTLDEVRGVMNMIL